MELCSCAAMLNYAGKAGDGNTAAFTAVAAAKTTRAVRAVNTDFGHLLCPGLRATLLVPAMNIWEPSLEVIKFCFGFISLPSSVRKAFSNFCCLSAVKVCYRHNCCHHNGWRRRHKVAA